jgi:hypothetical protein
MMLFLAYALDTVSRGFRWLADRAYTAHVRRRNAEARKRTARRDRRMVRALIAVTRAPSGSAPRPTRATRVGAPIHRDR